MISCYFCPWFCRMSKLASSWKFQFLLNSKAKVLVTFRMFTSTMIIGHFHGEDLTRLIDASSIALAWLGETESTREEIQNEDQNLTSFLMNHKSSLSCKLLWLHAVSIGHCHIFGLKTIRQTYKSLFAAYEACSFAIKIIHKFPIAKHFGINGRISHCVFV